MGADKAKILLDKEPARSWLSVEDKKEDTGADHASTLKFTEMHADGGMDGGHPPSE